MKKAIFSLVALCLIGMCSVYAVSLPGSPIVFVDIYGVMPCDDAEEGAGGAGRPDPNRVIGSINNRSLYVQMPRARPLLKKVSWVILSLISHVQVRILRMW